MGFGFKIHSDNLLQALGMVIGGGPIIDISKTYDQDHVILMV